MNSQKKGELPVKLQYIKLKVIPREDCKEALKRDVDPGQLCTYNKKGEGTCMVSIFLYGLVVIYMNQFHYNR